MSLIKENVDGFVERIEAHVLYHFLEASDIDRTCGVLRFYSWREMSILPEGPATVFETLGGAPEELLFD